MSEMQHDEVMVQQVEALPLPGQYLRKAREARGLSIQDIASNLRLSARVITALEADDYSQLPAATFVTGYLRAYARLLDVPESTLNFPQKVVKEPRLSSVSSANPRNRRNVPIRLLSMVIVLLLIASGIVWWMNNGDALLFERKVGSTSTPSLSMPNSEIDSPKLEQLDASGPVDVRVPARAPAPVEEPTVTSSVVEPEANIATLPTTPPSRVPVVLQAEIELHYSANSWTEITDSDEERLAFGLIESGTVLQLKGKAPFSVFLGYAPGVRVFFNDEQFDHAPFQRRDIARFRLGGPEHNRPISR